jgi:hypothetical protein
LSDDEWRLDGGEVESLGWLHGKSVYSPSRRPHDRCQACREAWPCAVLRLVRFWMDTAGGG